MSSKNLETILNSLYDEITQIPKDRKYWFVRTNGGAHYDSFIKNEIIAIGWDNITIDDIKKAEKSDEYRQQLMIRIVKADPTETRPGNMINQVRDFVLNIRKGDIVIIPSASSELYSFGIIKNTNPYNVLPSVKDPLKSIKRKDVKWIMLDIPYNKLDPYLFKLKYLQKTITEIDNSRVESAVDRTIASLFIRDEVGHLVLRIRKDDDVNAFDLGSALSDLLELTEDIAKENELNLNKRDFNAKINVQSPGTVEIITPIIDGILILTAIIAVTIGIDMEFKVWFAKFNLKTKGLIKVINDYKSSGKKRKLMETLDNKLQGMQLDGEEIVNVLKEISEKSGDNL